MTQVVEALGSALLLSLMDDDISEIQRWYFEKGSQIFTYRQLQNL